MIDTHCHLTDPRLTEQLDAVLQRASAAGVGEIVTIGTHPPDWDAAAALARAHPKVRFAAGAHPNYCHEIDFAALDRLDAFLSDDKFVALGEMGLEYHYGSDHRAVQKKFFEAQLDLARRSKLPVVIHCREAFDDCLAILKNFAEIKAVFHCFTGTAFEARQVWDAGYWMGFTGVVTFKNGAELRAIAAAAPVDRILVETDAPYLTPEPMRKQKTNEPALVMHTARAVAAARGITLQALDELTTANARAFYRWK
jgi:TatD DNase family protein